MWDTLSNTECKQIRSHSCRRHLNSTDEIQGDSFIKVTVGSVEGQNLHNLWNNNTSKKKKKTSRKFNSCKHTTMFFFLSQRQMGKERPTCWLDRAVQVWDSACASASVFFPACRSWTAWMRGSSVATAPPACRPRLRSHSSSRLTL